MVNDLLQGINNKLFEIFGDKYSIYNNEVKQDFEEPCFFILELRGSNDLVISNRYRRVHSFDVQYHPEFNNQSAQEINNTADILMEQMEYITVAGNLIRGTNMNYEKVDNVLHFFIDYDVFIIKPRDKLPFMVTLKQAQHTKG
ncbi:phage tail terminator family protein [Pectinatus frisingensis]|uniref:phage tail terminator family protein n=1 Tax=Pectinatus frisingensis TaxID=865 RepID=UPI0015F68676|nr:hypothetical protein [Pectinatus frisingensis]